ncbi:exo-beta-N-acetylmuramidase NamZ family protein [Fulvivirga lutea]|uniref:DUF1343 domain-containing protein n=1 Tax=Fulvivirga lutea TaxID=2810512 RepID=A0A975A2B4_9BACT|nr:DUF1343 domain-containing protein [Fulvivirga lutea]QSE99276.1 DUF1343 domain-containing protein [Fulvivirga lutea]
MQKPIFLFILLLTNLSCIGQNNQPNSEAIVVGAEQTQLYLPLLNDKKVALLANHSSLVGEQHIVDVLLANKVNIVKVLAPEHGFRGDKSDGVDIKDAKDEKTGIPIVSIYGDNKYIPEKLISDVDVLLFDIQDVGVRFYTFITAMHYAMEACAKTGTKFIVLDRPNPNGMYVDGPILDPKKKSYVGVHPIPIVHGLTVGELATMINGEGWLEAGKCELTVIFVKGYTHSTVYSLPVKPSPNLPNDQSIKLYPSLALFEGTAVSVGRGTQQPFTIIGHPELTELKYSFTPKSIPGMSVNPPLEGKKCYGYDLSKIDFKPHFTLKYLLEFYEMFDEQDQFFKDYFNKLVGNDSTIQQIKAGLSERDIKATWASKLNAYKKMRKKYLLYKDFE